jgi:hypothetical protein
VTGIALLDGDCDCADAVRQIEVHIAKAIRFMCTSLVHLYRLAFHSW